MEKVNKAELHDRIAVVDGHNDAVLRMIEEGPFILPERGRGNDNGWIEIFGEEPHRLDEESENGQIDLPKIIKGGVDCLIFAVYVSPQNGYPQKRLLQYLDVLHEEFERTEGIELARSYQDIKRIIDKGNVATLIALEGAHPLGGSLGVLREIKRLGVTVVTFTHWGRNILGEGSGADSGAHISSFGFDVIEEMNKQNMLIDVAHLNETGFYDVLENTKAPVLVSHANVKHFNDHHRNLSDDQLKILAQNGGVLGLSFVPEFISPGGFEDPESVTVEDLIDQIDYVVDLIGANHVGLGSDFDGGGGFPGLDDISKMEKITDELVKRGYSEGQIEKIAGGNFLRVFRQVLGDMG